MIFSSSFHQHFPANIVRQVSEKFPLKPIWVRKWLEKLKSIGNVGTECCSEDQNSEFIGRRNDTISRGSRCNSSWSTLKWNLLGFWNLLGLYFFDFTCPINGGFGLEEGESGGRNCIRFLLETIKFYITLFFCSFLSPLNTSWVLCCFTVKTTPMPCTAEHQC